MKTWADKDGIVHVMGIQLMGILRWPICYSKRHPEPDERLGAAVPTCLWCIATTPLPWRP